MSSETSLPLSWSQIVAPSRKVIKGDKGQACSPWNTACINQTQPDQNTACAYAPASCSVYAFEGQIHPDCNLSHKTVQLNAWRWPRCRSEQRFTLYCNLNFYTSIHGYLGIPGYHSGLPFPLKPCHVLLLQLLISCISQPFSEKNCFTYSLLNPEGET